MFPEDNNENFSEENKQQEQNLESDETTIEDFLDKFTVSKKQRKRFSSQNEITIQEKEKKLLKVLLTSSIGGHSYSIGFGL